MKDLITATVLATLIFLSKASKMPCKSWSLLARTDCPGSIIPKSGGKLVPACEGCYAAQGNYRYPNVRAPRIKNKEAWKDPRWVPAMIQAIGTDEFFRWFDSGDVYCVELASKILAVMRGTPNTRHWLPTRSHKFPKFAKVFAAMQRLPNAVVRRSSDSITGETVRGGTTSTIFSERSQLPKGATVCEAYQRDGKCGPCRACWDKDVATIAYPGHGRVMDKLQRIAVLEVAA